MRLWPLRRRHRVVVPPAVVRQMTAEIGVADDRVPAAGGCRAALATWPPVRQMIAWIGFEETSMEDNS